MSTDRVSLKFLKWLKVQHFFYRFKTEIFACLFVSFKSMQRHSFPCVQYDTPRSIYVGRVQLICKQLKLS